MKNLKLRLIVMNFLEFAVWGAYLTCMGNYLGRAGMGAEISWFYAIQGIVSIFMPTLMGIVADKYIQPQRLLGICHLIAGLAMIALAYMGMTNPMPDKAAFITLYTLSVAFYMPTLALANTTAFTILKDNGMDTEKDFPPIRVFGTIGFICTMWFVNCAVLDGGSFGFTLGENANKFQYTYMQFMVSGLLSVVLFLYCMTLPECKLVKKESQSLADSLGLSAFKLFKTKKMAMFFIFSAMLGMSLQVTNGFATPYLTHFKSDPAMADTFGANNATMLVSLSQIAEALCILLIPFFLKRYGIKVVMLIAMFAWGIFVDKECAPDVKASAQGLFMLMTNGLGATIGTLAAGAIVNSLCHWTEDGFLVGNTPTSWSTAWYIFASFALVVAVSFMFLFKYKHERQQ